MPYQNLALYRKARPMTFDEVKGQDIIVRAIRNQLINARTQHAYLFCGTRGTGKTSVAKILARAVNCEHPVNGNPCNECESCRSILSGASVNVIEIDAASNNGVDNIREIVEEVRYSPAKGNFKVYIIDEVHMLSTGAFNALLKTLEEPPSYVIFILATTDVGKIPATILSRCQRYDFHRIDQETIVKRLSEVLAEEGGQAEEKALRFVARTADGSLRDALSLLDECMAMNGEGELRYEEALNAIGAVDPSVFTELLAANFSGDAGKSVLLFERAIENGREIGQFLGDLLWTLRNLLILLTATGDVEELIDLSEAQMEELAALAVRTDLTTVLRDIRILSELQNTMRGGGNRRALFEVALIKMARPQMEADVTSLRARIMELEERLETLSDPAQQIRLPDEAHSRANEAAASEKEDVSKRERVPAKAAPADLQMIRKNWEEIIADVRGPLLKQLLRQAVPQYDPEDAEATLYVSFSAPIAEEYFAVADMEESAREALAKVIRGKYHIETPVAFRMRKEKNERLYSIRVDQIIQDKSKINFPVEQEA